MARAAGHPVTFHQAVEIVAGMAGEQLARELDRTHHVGMEFDAKALEFLAQKAIVEARVVRNQKLAVEPRFELARNFSECWRQRYHIVADAGQRFDERRD